MIPMYRPFLPKSSLEYAHDALNSTWISSQGKYIDLATEKLRELLNVKYALLLNNGTSACHLVAKCLAKQNINKIIVPNNVYVAAWNAFLFDSNYTLYTVECDINTWNYDLDLLDIAIKTHPDAAVLIVHNIGNIINVPMLQEKYPNTILVEDDCEGLMGKYNDKYSGTESFASAISFFANKHCTSGEGGAFITNDENSYLYAKCVQGQGQSEKRFIHNELGYNYRITNIQSAILLGQLEILPQILEMKHNIFNKYRYIFNNREDVFIQKEELNTTHANWMFGIRIPKQISYEIAERFFKDRSIEIRPMFYAIDKHKHIQNNKNIIINDCINADLLNKQCIILPSFPELTDEEQNHIINTTEEYIKGLQ